MPSIQNAKVKLYNGVEMPIFGLGVHRAKAGEEVETAVKCALQAGYRSIDTATYYQNEQSVGKAILESGIPREEIFLTSKVWNSDQGYHSTIKAFGQSLEKLQTNYLDLYLIHWPQNELTLETWKAMEELYRKGQVRAIGVCNFLVRHIKSLTDKSLTKPMVNQFEFHPELVQPELLQFCKDNQIQPEAWRPIMKGKVNDLPLLQALSAKYQKSPVQIVLRWDIQKGVVTIPKSVTPERIIHNADIFDFELGEEDIAKIDSLDKNARMGEDPNNFYIGNQ
jgi:diketogulonate reductase-like aldo/keto reductase